MTDRVYFSTVAQAERWPDDMSYTMILEGSYCMLGSAWAKFIVVDPNAPKSGPLTAVSDDMWDQLAEAYRRS